MKKYPLLQTQMGIFVECMKYPEATQYNLPSITRLTEEVDVERLEQALCKIYQVRRELRLGFSIDHLGNPSQFVLEDNSFHVTKKHIRESELEYYAQNSFVRPFDLLGNAPLFRAEMVETETGKYLLMDYHHILMDGVSTDYYFLRRDMSAAYLGEEFTDSGFGMLEYAEEEKTSGLAFERDRSYYVDKFRDVTLANIGGGTSDILGRLLIEAVSLPLGEIENWCREQKVPADVLFQSAFSHVVSVFTQEEQIAYTMMGHGRYDKRIREAFGMYVETLPVSVKKEPGMTVTDFLKIIGREKTLALRHHSYPFTYFCQELQKRPGIGFNYLAMEDAKQKLYLGDIVLQVRQISPLLVFADLTVSIYREEQEFQISVSSNEYKNDQVFLRIFAEAIRDTVVNMMGAPDALLKHIPVVSADKEQKLLELSAGEQAEYGKERTWIHMFQEAVKKNPDHIAVVDTRGSITYQELDKQSDAVAFYLRTEGVAVNEFVAVRMSRIKEFAVAVLGIQKAGAAYVPIDEEYPKDRIQYMLKDSDARITIDEAMIRQILRGHKHVASVNDASAQQYAYMIYTSGSTGRPKGVVQSHRSLYQFVNWRIEKLGITADGNYGHFNSFSFDGSLDDLVCPLAAGAAVHIFDETFRRSLVDICDYVEKHRITGMTTSTQFGMELIRYNPDLSLDYLMMGGEKLLPPQKTAFRVINGYGPTEFTVCSSYYIVNGTEKSIPIGRPVPNTFSLICDIHGNLLPQGVVGELCLAGPQMAEGYWKQPELTEHVFCYYCINGENIKVYRTGDLARYNEDGQLEYSGRRDQQVKLRGYRVEFGEIENQARRHPYIEQAAAEVKHDQIVLYYTRTKSGSTVEKKQIEEEVTSLISETLAQYMVPGAYVMVDEFPMTPGGKIDRKALPDLVLSELSLEAPADETEKTLLELAEELVEMGHFGVTDNLIGLGMSSIAMMRYAAEIQDTLNARIAVSVMMKNPTVRGIAMRLSRSVTAGKEPVRKYEERESYPLTENQKGVYLDWEMHQGRTQYNVPSVYILGEIEEERILKAIDQAVEAHSYLKTRLAYEQGELIQKRSNESICVSRTILDFEPDQAFFQGKVRPFDLLKEGLCRIELLSFKTKYWLFIDVHHIVYDGISNSILIHDIISAYKNGSTTEETITAYDFALFEQDYKNSGEFQNAKAYFDQLVAGMEESSYPDSVKPDECEYGVTSAKVPAMEINRFCQENDVTAGSFLQAAFAETLRRITREENLLYVTVSSGRMTDTALLNSIGMYVRTLPVVIGAGCAEDGTTIGYIKSVHEKINATLRHELYPYTKIVEDHGIHANILFTFQGGIYEGGEVEGVRQIPLNNDTVKFDLCVTVYPSDDQYEIMIEYNGKRYGIRDMQILANAIGRAALNLTQEELLKNVGLLNASEEQKLVEMSTGRKLDFDKTKTWLDLFDENVKTRPNHPALVDQFSSYTYKELDTAADSIAAYLVNQGIEKNDFVIIKMDRVKEFGAAAIGVQKAGACYVPIDPAYPPERIRYMEEDSEAKVILDEEYVEKILKEIPNPLHMNKTTPDNWAYMIYTSGSTGRPKGSVLHQKGLMNLAMGNIEAFGIVAEDRITSHRSFSFDAHVADFYPALSAGATLFLIPEEIRKEPDQIYEFLLKHRITGGGYATAMMSIMYANYDLKQRYITGGGEALLDIISDSTQVFNEYGPTECTDNISIYRLEKDKHYESVPLGKAMVNGWLFILDPAGKLLPAGVRGEICYAGSQVGWGYWKLPDKTDEVFGDCPFVPGERMYHTGDLGYFNEDGDIVFAGRIDFQVKLHGFRIELEEIESCALRCAGIEQVAARILEDKLILYYTVKSEVNVSQLKEFMEKTLADYMVPGFFIQMDEMPMTPSGKVDRKSLPIPVIQDTAEYIAPETEEEIAIAESIQKILGIQKKVSVLDNFFELGGDSIKAIRVTSLLRQMDIVINVSDIMKHKTVREIAKYIKTDKNIEVKSQTPFEGTVTQTAIFQYFHNLALPECAHYNQAVCLRMKEKGEFRKIQEAINALTYQHDLLRAIIKDGKLFVRPANEQIMVCEYAVSSRNEISKICERLQKVIKMDEALVQCAYFETEEESYLFIAAHHLIIDGVSWRILISDLEKAYRDIQNERELSLPAKTSTYQDYAKALETYRNSYVLSLEIPYWREIQKKMSFLPCSRETVRRSMGKLQKRSSVEETKSFLNANYSSLSVDVNDLLVTAVCRSYCSLTGEDSVSLQLEGHGRENFDPELLLDRTVGWFTSIYPAVVENLSGDRKRDLLQVKETLHRIPEKGVGYNILRFLEGEAQNDFDAERIPRIGFNYLGEMTAEQTEGSIFEVADDIDTGEAVSRLNISGPDIAINCQVINGKMHLTLDYNQELMDAKMAESFVSGIFEEIERIASLLASEKETIVTATDLGETEWSMEEFEDVVQEFASRGEQITRIYPLLPMQEGMLYEHESNPQSWAYRLVNIYELDVLPEEKQLRSVLKRLGEKHEVLRTAIIYDGVKQARQAIVERELPLFLEDFSAAEDQEQAIASLRKQILTNNYDLQRKPLFQLYCVKKSDDTCWLLMATHHIIVDGWCLRLYQNDFFRFLSEEMSGAFREVTEKSTAEKYEEAVRAVLHKDKNAGLRYWRTLLEDYETKAEITSYGNVPEKEQSDTEELFLLLDQKVTKQYEKLCSEEQATLSNGAELAWGLVLQTYNRTSDVVFAKVVSGRDNPGIDVDDVVGLFINSVPVRVKTDKTETARQMLNKLQKQAVASNEWDFCPLSEVQQVSHLGMDLISSVFVFENYNSGVEEDPETYAFHVKKAILKEERFNEIEPCVFVLDGKLGLRLTFNKAHYRRCEIERISELFRVFITGMVQNPDCSIAALSRLSEKQKNKIIELSSGEKLSIANDQTWLDRFEVCVCRQPDHLAVEDENGSYTYEELAHASDQVAVYLMKHGVTVNEFVVIKMHRLKEFAVCVIGIQKIGACYIPIDPNYPEDRIAYMEQDSQAKIVLDEELVGQILEETVAPERINNAKPENLAYMIYTSGSTGKPKGAMLSHRALLNYTEVYIRRFEITQDDRLSHHITFSFDSHIRDFYPALAAGASLHFMSDAIVKEPDEIASFLEEKQITGSAYATAMGQLLLGNYNLKQRFISIGGEALHGICSENVRVFNVCGATECTDVVVDYELEKGRYYDSAPIGKALPNCYAFILDENSNLLPQGIAGEICYAGAHIGAGYWNRKAETEKVFVDCPFIPGERMYHTGDLGRYNENGDVEYLGRIDFQVKLRGFRVELGEVESCAIQYPGIDQVVAAVHKDNLILYYISEQSVDATQLKAFMAQTLTGYMIPALFMQIDALPMTPSGKIDRKKLPEPDIQKEEVLCPQTETEKRVYQLVTRFLPEEGLGVNNGLISLGMTSLDAMRLNAAIAKELGTNLKVADIMKYATIRSISERIDERAKESGSEDCLCHYEEREYYPITENQRGLYIDWEMNRDTTQYNTPNVYVFTEIDVQRLADSVKKAVNVHSYLKTRLVLQKRESVLADGTVTTIEQVMQKPNMQETVEIEVVSLEQEPNAEYFQKLVKPFDLLGEKLYCFRIVCSGSKTFLFIDIHHIIFDGLSNARLIQDILAAYRGEEIKEEEVTALDYALYEHRFLEDEKFNEISLYFENLVQDANCVRYPDSTADVNPNKDNNNSAVIKVSLSEEEINHFCKMQNVTVGSFWQAAFAETLHRMTREEKLLYVTISNGRSAGVNLENSMGMFVKTLPVVFAGKEQGHAKERTADYVKAVHEQLQNTYEREVFPYTYLVEKYRLHADIMFAYQGEVYDSSSVEVMELKLETVKFPVLIMVYPENGAYTISLEYDCSCYSRRDIQVLADAFANIAGSMAVSERIDQVEMVSQDQKKELNVLGHGRNMYVDPNETIVSMFRNRVAQTQDAVAVVFREKSLTYGEIDRITDRLAGWLKKQYQIGTGDTIGVLIRRSELMLIYPLAVMKTGAAYMPLDPQFPEDRLCFMCEDASVNLILYEGSLISEKMPLFKGDTFGDQGLDSIPDSSQEELELLEDPKPESLLTVLFTSGSTGMPKGVMLEHKGIVNYCHWYVEEYAMTSEDHVAGYANFGFDAHMIDLYPTVLAGGTVYIFDEELRMDILAMNDYMEQNQITIAFFTTQIGCLIKDINHSLRLLSTGGEKMLSLTAPKYRFLNVYGPTECSLFSTYYEIHESFDGGQIGRPLANYQLYVIDQNAQLVPRGIPGELLIAGAGVARGYLNRQELTEEKFISFTLNEESAPVRAYRSGDLVRWDEDGQIEYISRIDTQVKLRGFRIELGEIESWISTMEGVSKVIVDILGDVNRQLCCYYVANREITLEELQTYLSEKLTDYMIPEVMIRLDELPMTPNGKTDRKALRALQVTNTAGYVEPETELERKVAQLMKKILGLTEQISALDSFYALGGDSIKAIRLVSLLREENIHISVKDIMKQKTVRKIAFFAENQENSILISQEPEQGEVEDTAIVRFFKDLKLPSQEHFIQSMFLSMRERADRSRLQQALDAVTRQHDMLRAVMKDDKLVIREYDAAICIEEYQVSSEEEIAAYCKDVRENIHMEEALLRAAILHGTKEDYLYLVAHHLIIDGVSWRILTADLESAYDSALKDEKILLPAKTSSYPSYAKEISQYRNSYVLEKEIPYWDQVQRHLEQTGVCLMKDYSRSFGSYVAVMDREATASFIHADREKLQLEINDILITALARGYCMALGRETLSMQLEGHGRENFHNNLVIDRTIGWFTSIYPVVLENIRKQSGTDEKESLAADLINVKETLHRIPNKGAGYLILRYLEGNTATGYSKDIAPQISFNYLGELDAEQNNGGLFRVENGKEQTGEETREHSYGSDLDLNCVLVNGCFTLMMSYNEQVYDRQRVTVIAEQMFAELGKVSEYLNSCENPVITASDLGENVWTEEVFERVQMEFSQHNETISRIYPLLPMQEGMLYKHISEPESWAYRLVSIFEMNRIPTEGQLRHQLDLLGEKHEVLRTSFVYEGVPIARQVLTDRKIPYEFMDFSDEQDPFLAVCRLRKEILTNGYDLTWKPLFRIICVKKSEDHCYIVVITHHMIVDGWSQQNYLADLFGGLMGHEIQTGDSTNGYYESYIRSIMQRDKKESLRYFERLLKGYETRAQIPSYGLVPESKQSSEDELHLIIPKDVSDHFVGLCMEEKATISNGVELVWGLILQTYSHTEDAVFAKVVSGRDKSNLNLGKVTGLFINSVPVRVQTDQEVTARQMLVRLQQQAAETNEHDYCSLAEVQQVSELGSDLLQTVIAFQNYGGGVETTEDYHSSDVTIRPVMLREETFAELNITTGMTEREELILNISFDKTRYTAEEIKQVMELFRLFVTEITKEPDCAVSRLPRLSTETAEQVKLLSSGEQMKLSKEQTWVDLFLKNADAYQDQIAVADADGSITYPELDRQSDAVANMLIEQGVKPDQFTAIRIGREKEFIIAVLGIMKAGAAFVPIDTEYPEDRIRYMLDDSEAAVVLTKDSVRQAVLSFSDTGRINLAKPDGNAYMIYTSGSTGRPKGVVQSHHSLHNFVSWRIPALGLKKGGRYGHFNSFSFDGSLDDIACPLAAGGAIYIIDEETRRDLFAIHAFLKKNEINGLTMSTQMGMELIRLDPELELEYLMMGGEKLLPYGKTTYKLINGYGPTEFTVCSSYYIVHGDEEEIPIGRPVPNTSSYICDQFGNAVPQGVLGELCLVGEQMAKEYWKQPELTNDRFTQITVGKERFNAYRTGDLARYNEDGQLIYAGRTDTQVKLRGYRVEFGEIENRALQFEGVEQVAANVCKDSLVLYYTMPEESVEEGFEERLHDFIAETVTDFMVPTIFVHLQELPVTPNGKIDRNALPEPELLLTEAYEEPANEYEKLIAKSMQEILELKGKVGALDRFYALGGDSIKVIRLISLLHSKGIQVKVADFKELQTVRKIAEVVAMRNTFPEISQEAIEGEIEDSAIICFFKDLQLPVKEHFTQEILLGMKKRGSSEQIQNLIRALTEQHDMLRAVWREEHLYIRNKNTEIEVGEYDLRGAENETAVSVCNRIRLGIRMDEALFRTALIHTEQKDLLYMVAHHTIIDGVSWRILLSDLEIAYRQILAGVKPQLPAKTSTYRDYVEASREYRTDISNREENGYWKQIQKKLMNDCVSEAKDYSRHFGRAAVTMGSDATRKVMTAERSKMNLEINDVLVTAVARAYCRLDQKSGLSIQMEGHGREDIKEGLALDRTIGWFTSIYPIVLEQITAAAADDIGRDLITVKETLHRLPNKGVGYNLFRFLDGEERITDSTDRIAKLSFNYLGEVGEDRNPEAIFKMETMTGTEEKEQTTENGFGSDLNINCMVEKGKFILSLTYDEEKYREEQAVMLTGMILDELERAAEYLNQLREQIVTAVDYQEDEWTEEEFETVLHAFAKKGLKVDQMQPLTEKQTEIFEKLEKGTGSFGYAYVGVFEINTLPSQEQLNRVLERMTEKYDILRTFFVLNGNGKARQILTDHRLKAQMHQGLPEKNHLDLALEIREQLLNEKVDLENGDLLKVHCVPNIDNGSNLIIAVHDMASGCLKLSPELVAAKCLGYLAGEQNQNLKIRDQIVKEPVQAFYREGIRVCGLDYKYDPCKPTFVFPCGIILHKSISHLIDAWSDQYNVVVYDTINLHFQELFSGETYDDIMDFYMTLLEFMLPEPDKLFGCIGYSFGGEIAYSMATRTARVRNCQPIVFLGDSDLIPCLGAEAERETSAADFGDQLINQLKEHDIPQESMIFAYNMLGYLNARKKTLETYDGKTVLLLALQNTTEKVIETRKILAAKVAKDLKVIEFPDRDHFSLHTDPKMSQIYNEMLKEYVEEGNKLKR